VLPQVGHMIQNAAPDLVISEINTMIGELAQRGAAAADLAEHARLNCR
jgi:hypothetical protein